MAVRPIFIPIKSGPPFVVERMLDFTWHPGFAISQAQKSIASLHAAAERQGIHSVLEISSKSTNRLGVQLSAFNLQIVISDRRMSVECAFQGSKVFERGGPYLDLYSAPSLDAKRDSRLRSSGDLIHFQLFDTEFPLEPPTAFYDWLYLKALSQNEDLASELLQYEGFTDIAFNPEKSLNCQAHSAALWVALNRRNLIQQALADPVSFIQVMRFPSNASDDSEQLGLFE